jgi:hypothetical protein
MLSLFGGATAVSTPAEAAQDFAMPSPPPPRLAASVPAFAGHELRITDENGTYVIRMNPDGSLRARYRNKSVDGKWWTQPDGRLCFVSAVYWTGGFCFWVYGRSVEEVVGVQPWKMQGHLFPAEVRP